MDPRRSDDRWFSAQSRGRVSPRIGLNMIRIDDTTEWLEADGLGGFASGTTSGIRTRRYHALLLTAETPPTGRVVLVNGLDAWVEGSERLEVRSEKEEGEGLEVRGERE